MYSVMEEASNTTMEDNSSSLANILSFNEVRKYYHVTYDSKKSNVFYVHVSKDKVR